MREKLEIIENEDVYKLIRCFYADHIPYAIEISFVPTGLILI
ncbi:UTRA domain-containing protein [[Ruminococcus] torques]|nr:UTRA domain-containing protein [[Ruminococcus] torques]